MVAVPEAIRSSIAILQAHQNMKRKPPRRRPSKGTQRGRSSGRRGTKNRSHSLEQAARATVEVFAEVGTRWALVGAGAYAMLVEPRATEDFDLVVEGEKLQAVLEGLR